MACTQLQLIINLLRMKKHKTIQNSYCLTSMAVSVILVSALCHNFLKFKILEARFDVVCRNLSLFLFI